LDANGAGQGVVFVNSSYLEWGIECCVDSGTYTTMPRRLTRVNTYGDQAWPALLSGWDRVDTRTDAAIPFTKSEQLICMVLIHIFLQTGDRLRP
jgi:hypothetical protein